MHGEDLVWTDDDDVGGGGDLAPLCRIWHRMMHE